MFRTANIRWTIKVGKTYFYMNLAFISYLVCHFWLASLLCLHCSLALTLVAFVRTVICVQQLCCPFLILIWYFLYHLSTAFNHHRVKPQGSDISIICMDQIYCSLVNKTTLNQRNSNVWLMSVRSICPQWRPGAQWWLCRGSGRGCHEYLVEAHKENEKK